MSDALRLNIKNTPPPLIKNVLYSLLTRPVIVTREFGCFDEPVFGAKFEEGVFVDEVVCFPVYFAFAGWAGCVRDTEPEFIWMFFKETVEEGTLACPART